jgi:hypothetical protein
MRVPLTGVFSWKEPRTRACYAPSGTRGCRPGSGGMFRISVGKCSVR